MTTRVVVEIIIILLLLVANGVFAMTEMAVVSARKSKLKKLIEAGVPGAHVALQLAESPNRFLPTVQIGITIMGLLAAAFGGATVAEQIAAALEPHSTLAPYAEAIGLGVVVVALTYLSLIIGELVPKRLALARDLDSGRVHGCVVALAPRHAAESRNGFGGGSEAAAPGRPGRRRLSRGGARDGGISAGL